MTSGFPEIVGHILVRAPETPTHQEGQILGCLYQIGCGGGAPRCLYRMMVNGEPGPYDNYAFVSVGHEESFDLFKVRGQEPLSTEHVADTLVGLTKLYDRARRVYDAARESLQTSKVGRPLATVEAG